MQPHLHCTPRGLPLPALPALIKKRSVGKQHGMCREAKHCRRGIRVEALMMHHNTFGSAGVVFGRQSSLGFASLGLAPACC